MRNDFTPPLETAPMSDLAAIPGDTYAVRAELKTLGAVWDKNERVWKIAPEKLGQARALVENHALVPVAPESVDIETMTDPFEQEGDGPRYVSLSSHDGDVFAAKEALKAIGARWDKSNRSWRVREERAEYARAIVAAVTNGDALPEEGNAPTLTPAKRKRAAPTVYEAAPPAEDAPAPPEAAPIADAPPETVVTEPKATPPAVPAPIVLGGLWKRRGEDGKVYLWGRLSEGVEIHIVSNDARGSAEEPSHQMVLFPAQD